MEDDFIDYGKLIDDAMHIIVRQALEKVSKEGLPGNHHFFISFLTQYPGVKISKNLLKKYPDEMTVVLQHQFEEMKVSKNYFEVTLSFDGVKEKIRIPFKSLVAFADPSVKFGLQFRHVDVLNDLAESDLASLAMLEEDMNADDAEYLKDLAEDLKIEIENKKPKKPGDNNVVDINSFRKK